jgi:hypothetical protein
VTSGYLTALDRGWKLARRITAGPSAFIRWATGGRTSNRASRTQPAGPAGPQLQLLSMLGINKALGDKPYIGNTTWQVPIDSLVR